MLDNHVETIYLMEKMFYKKDTIVKDNVIKIILIFLKKKNVNNENM